MPIDGTAIWTGAGSPPGCRAPIGWARALELNLGQGRIQVREDANGNSTPPCLGHARPTARVSRRGVVSVLERSGYATAIATGLIFAANMAVDGVALKRAVDAWAAAADADKPFVSLPLRRSAGWRRARTLSSKSCSD